MAITPPHPLEAPPKAKAEGPGRNYNPVQKRELSKQEKGRRRRLNIMRRVRRALPWLVLIAIIGNSIAFPVFRQVILLVLSYAGRLIFPIMFILVQFVALFFFLARTKTEIIRPGDANEITFEDYKGQPKLLELVRQWISLLQDREQFTQMGGKFINGLLLYGPPGTGKTYLAKAMAGEADIAFISIEGSGFRAMFIGIDILKMIQFINKAKKLAREYGACIAYIDEIDAVGASRGSVMTGNNSALATGPSDTRLYQRLHMMMGGMGGGGGSGALTRLLVAMDGIDERTRGEKRRAWWAKLRGKPVPERDWHLLFMGATNRPDVLDPALTRPGRFDTLISVDAPDKAGRREIISYYLTKVQHDDTLDLEAIVNDTNGYTPAALQAAITKSAVRIAIFNGRNRISQSDIDRALIEQAGGLENPIEEMPEEQRRQLAYHEAGHAVAVYYLTPHRRLTRGTIIRSGTGLGYVSWVHEYERQTYPLREIVADIMVSMAGHVATQMALGEHWVGAGGDFQSVRARMWQLASYGYFGPPMVDMTQLMAVGNFEGEQFDFFWKRIEDFWKQTEAQVEEFMGKHIPELDAVAAALLESETLTGKELREIIQAATQPNGHKSLDYVDATEELKEVKATLLDNAERRTEPTEESAAD